MQTTRSSSPNFGGRYSSHRKASKASYASQRQASTAADQPLLASSQARRLIQTSSHFESMKGGEMKSEHASS